MVDLVSSLDETEVCAQPASGSLRKRGVELIIHARGPNWADHESPTTIAGRDALVHNVTAQIRATVVSALRLAEQTGLETVSIPALSGGIFTHKGFDSQSRALRRIEEQAARDAVARAVVEWARLKGSIDRIDLVTPPAVRTVPRADETKEMMLRGFRKALEATR
jgi:O-acetyl-ADP-ribose deacetylase (regulator of RNase III)